MTIHLLKEDPPRDKYILSGPASSHEPIETVPAPGAPPGPGRTFTASTSVPPGAYVVQASENGAVFHTETVRVSGGQNYEFRVPEPPSLRAPALAQKPTPPAGYTGVPAKPIRGTPACIPHHYSPDGKWLAAQDHGGNYATFRVWDARTGEPRLTRDVRSARIPEFSPDGRRLAVPEGSAGSCHIVVFDTATFEEVKRWPCDVKADRVVFDRTSKILAARDGDSVALYDSETGTLVTRIESTNAPNGLAFSPTADLLAVEHMLPGRTNGEGRWVSRARVVLYDVDPKSPNYKKALHTWDTPDTGDSHQLRFTPDGSRIAFTHGTGNGLIGLFVYDLKTGRPVAKFVPEGKLTQIGVGPFLPDGRTLPLTFGGGYGTIGLWDATTEQVTHAWSARDRGFHPTLVVDPTGRTLCTGGTKTAEPLFFDLATGQELVPGQAAEARSGWAVLTPAEAKAENGTTLTAQPGGAVLASGKHPDKDTYVIMFSSPPTRVAALRLDVLPHDSLPNKGPGRHPHPDKSFVLTAVRAAL
ncbi:MAG: hypothetical protein K2V38_02375, partial [Gemmataceae bacterium]|nr:hypothetical protein [Gemmataceae bacterium]